MILPPGPDTQEKLFPGELRTLGNRVSREEAPRMLLRYPGACGVRDHFNETLSTLARPDLKVCHFTTELIPYIREGARRFGLFVVPNPDGRIPLVRLPGDEPAYLSANTPLKRDQDYCWVPASLLEELQTEKPSASIQEIIELHGDRIVRARVDARFEIENYFGEISRVISSGIPLPEERWHELSEVQRRTILREIGAQPSWTIPASDRLSLQ